MYGHPASPMRLHKLSLENFRGFKSLELDLKPNNGMPIVLVGINGAGKSTILDAIALMLSWFSGGIRSGKPDGPVPSENDVRVGAGTCVLSLVANFPVVATELRWTVFGTRPGYPELRTHNVATLTPAIEAVQQTIAAGLPRLPLAVHYPTNRSAIDIPARIRMPRDFDALSAYDGALEGSASDFRGFFEWFREEEDVYNTWRRDTNRILEAAFGDPGRPKDVAEKLRALKEAVDDDRVVEARSVIRELHDLIEGQDPEVFFYEQLLPPEEAKESP